VLYDAFSLVKRDGQPNELIDEKPGTPEHVRPTEADDEKRPEVARESKTEEQPAEAAAVGAGSDG
jgi:hypothetical protein